MDFLLGIDVRSTSMKALVYDLDGNVISRGSRPTESIANDPDHANWQVYLPDHIWDGIASAIREAVSRIGPQDRILAAAVTGLARMQYPWMSTGKRFILLLPAAFGVPLQWHNTTARSARRLLPLTARYLMQGSSCLSLHSAP